MIHTLITPEQQNFTSKFEFSDIYEGFGNFSQIGTYRWAIWDQKLFTNKEKYRNLKDYRWASFHNTIGKFRYEGIMYKEVSQSKVGDIHCSDCDAYMGKYMYEGGAIKSMSYCIYSPMLCFEVDAEAQAIKDKKEMLRKEKEANAQREKQRKKNEKELKFQNKQK